MKQGSGKSLALPGLVLCSVCLRLLWLSRLGLWGDEDISTLAIRGILREGIPRLPSGEIYIQGLTYHYFAAPWAWVCRADWFPRLFSVLLSGLTVAGIVRWGREFVGRHGAILGAVLFAVSLPELQLARQIRFYAMYQLLALAALVFAYRSFQRASSSWSWAAAPTILVASSVHMLGTTLPVLLGPAAVRLKEARERVLWFFAAAVGALPAVFFVLVLRAPQPGGEGAAGPGEASILAGVAAATAGAVAFALGWAGAERDPWSKSLRAGAWAVVLGLAAVGQLGAAWVLFVCAMLLEGDWGRRDFKTPLLLLGLMLVLSVPFMVRAWLASPSLPRAVGMVGGDTIRLARGLLTWPWSVSALALLGAGCVLWRSWRGSTSDGPRFLLLVILLCLAARGLVTPKAQERYLADLWPAWELLAGWGAMQAYGWIERRMTLPSVARALGIAAFMAGVALSPGTSARDVYHYLALRPGEPNVNALSPKFVPDWRSVARWLDEGVSPAEKIAATDWVTAYCYLNRVDYWLRSDAYRHQAHLGPDGIYRDVYLGAEVVRTPEELLARAREAPIWVLVGGLELEVQDEKLTAEFRRWLAEQEPVFVAKDGKTRVIYLDATQTVRSALNDDEAARDR